MNKLLFGSIFFLLISSQININAVDELDQKTPTYLKQAAQILKKASPFLIFAAILGVAYSFNQQEEAERFCWGISRINSDHCQQANDFNTIYSCVYNLLLDKLREDKIKCTYVKCMMFIERREFFLLSRETQEEIKQCILDYLFRRKYR